MLQLDAESMRRLGYDVIDRIVEHYGALRSKPANRVRSRQDLDRSFSEPLPREAGDAAAVLDRVVDEVFGSIGHLNHPRFFGFIPTPSNFVSAMADALAAGFTPFCGSWLEGSGPGAIELTVVEWLRQLFGLPESAGGLFLSGGSVATLAALAAARDSQPGTDTRQHLFYCSDQTHASVDRALRIIGYADEQIRRLASGDDFRLDVNTLTETIERDRVSGSVPVAVIANAGTTNTGAIDPLDTIADLCARERMWMHVDGAYGAAAIFTDRGAGLLKGIERCDSLTLDPHKWLFQPYPLGCLLVRRRAALRRVFSYTVKPAYLQDTEVEGGDVNFMDLGPELTRPFRALKLWMSLMVFGADAFARAIDHGFATAELAERLLRSRPHWQIVSAAAMGIVAFRYIAADGGEDALNRNIADAVAEDGCCFVSTTVLRGRTVLRFCTIQPTTTPEDVQMSIDCMERAAARLTAR